MNYLITFKFNLLRQVEFFNQYFLLINLKTQKMKNQILMFFSLIAITTQAQFSEEKVLEDGSHYIVYTPRHFSAEELANWKPRRIPTTAEIQKNPLIPLSNIFMRNLESTLKINVSEDSSLVTACDIHFFKHLGINDVNSEIFPVRYHQIWEMKESVVNYNFNKFSQSLIKMIQDNHLDSYLHKTVQFYCKQYFYNGKYFLVAIVND